MGKQEGGVDQEVFRLALRPGNVSLNATMQRSRLTFRIGPKPIVHRAKLRAALIPSVNQVVSQQSGIANDSIETALQRFSDRMTDGRSTVSDFTAVQRLRGNICDTAQSAQ